MFIVSVLPLFSQPCAPESAEQKELRVEGVVRNDRADKRAVELKDAGDRGRLRPLSESSVLVAEERFVDDGDGTVTDTSRKIMWQKGDNGREVTFEEAQAYCKTLRLGGYADWRLPDPDERDTAVAIVLMMPRHSRDVYAYFDLYWSSNHAALIPFNYHPSYGKEVLRAYFAREGTLAFVRAVRPVGNAKPKGTS
jgi:hypothetical protein